MKRHLICCTGTLRVARVAQVAQLVGLGFPKAQAVEALVACDYNVEAAASLLFSGF